ncbi:MAG: hypothetical protein CFE45_32735 [Burkholderiales bacterium PBB5]|nr:MAG: hypothetical protein CFE45_32735 [Burkholderiales bacterium PBB5]
MPGWTLGADLGRAIGHPLRARSAQVWLATDLEPTAPSSAAARPVVRTEWVTSLQHHTRVARADGSTRSLDTIGLELNRYLGRNLYLSAWEANCWPGRPVAVACAAVVVLWRRPSCGPAGRPRRHKSFA